MDPLTVVTTVGAVSKGVFTCVTSLWQFIENVETVDETIRALYNEVNGFARMVNSISATMHSPSVKREERLALWEDVNNSLHECHGTIQRLEISIAEFGNKGPSRLAFIKDAYKQFRLDMKDDEISHLRAQIHSHSQTLSMSLSMINVHIASTGNQILTDTMSPQIEELLSKVREVHDAVLSKPTGDATLDKQHTRLVKTAEQVASRATVIMSRSTVAGSEADVLESRSYGRNARKPSLQPSETTGSELGEPLKPESRNRISAWLQRDGLEAVEEEGSKIGSNESRNTEDTFTSGTATLLPIDDFGSDEEELELEMAHKILTLGRQKFKEGKYSQAESALRRALGKFQAFGPKSSDVDLDKLSLEIADACFQQDKLDAAQEFCENCQRELPEEDSSRVRALEASYLLARIRLRQGSFDAARRMCKQTMNGRFRLERKSQAYYECVALLVTICHAQGDELDGMTYESMLPDDFEMPMFKLPAAQADHTSTPLTSPKSEAGIKQQVPGSANSGKGSLPLTEDALRSLSGSPAESGQSRQPPQLPVRNKPLEPPAAPFAPFARKPVSEEAASPTDPRPPPPPASKPPPPPLPHRSPSQRTPAHEAVGMSRPPITPYEPKSMSDDAVMSRTSLLPKYGEQSTKATAPTRSVSAPVVKRKRSLPVIPTLAPVAKAVSAFEIDEAVRVLTINNRDPRDKNFDSQEALLWAAEYGHDLPVRLLLQGWSQEVKKKTFGITSRDVVHRRGVYVDTLDILKRTPLHLAATFGHDSTCQILLERGASTKARQACPLEDCPNPDCKLGSTALEVAVARGDESVVKVFLAKGADLSPAPKTNFFPIHLAVLSGKEDVVLLLLAAKVDPKVKDFRGYTTLHHAAQGGHSSIVELLIDLDVPLDGRDKEGSSPLAMAVTAGHQDCVEILIERGANVMQRDDLKVTALHIAAVQNHEHLVPLLLAQGVDLDVREAVGGTPLHYAASSGGKELARKLLAAGADPLVRDNDGYTILHWAAQAGHDQFIEMAVDLGLYVDERSTAGQTPLMSAALGGHAITADKLILRGAKVSIKDNEGHSAMWHAIETKQRDVAWVLKSAGAEYCQCDKCDGVLSGYDLPDDPYASMLPPWTRGSLMPPPPPGLDPYLPSTLGYPGYDPNDPYMDALLRRPRDPLDDPLARLPPRLPHRDY